MNFPPTTFYNDRQKHLNLWWQGILFIMALLLINLLLYAFDRRMLADEALWIKPIKFEVSIIIHFATLAFLAAYLSPERRNSLSWKVMSYLVVGSGVAEILYIFLQAARGRESHFNDTTTTEIVMYGLMGVGAVILVAGSFYLGYLLYREYQESRQQQAQNNVFLLSAALGLTTGSAMTLVFASHLSSSPDYLSASIANGALQAPLLGWYLDGRDLRIPHFLATHMMQLIPLYGLWLSQKSHTTDPKKSLYWVAGAYSLLVITLFAFAALT